MNQHQQDSSSDNPTDRRGAKIAFVGIGRMGSRLSRRLQDAGYTLTIYDKDPTQMLELAHRGAKVASTARAAADAADLVFSMVNDGRSLREVAGGGEGILRAETPPHVYIDMTTVDPESSAYVAELAESSCVSYLRAAVSGSTTLAETGDLTILVSGNASTFERHLPLLKLLGKNVYYVGNSEQARYLKLALNMMIAATMQSLAEALGIAEMGGIDRALALEVMGHSAIGSPLIRYKTPTIASSEYEKPASPLSLMVKDVSLALGVAASANIPVPVTALVGQLLTIGEACGLGQLDFSALVLQQEQLAGRRRDANGAVRTGTERDS